jgi:AcrR family transcriptional regulator
MSEAPREKILSTAMRLFNKQGAHGTGVDQIIAESGVAKRTFYRYFPSKVDLLAEYFRQKHEIWYARLTRFAAEPAATPLDRLLSVFDSLKEWFSEPDFFGCAFIRGLSDFGLDCDAPVLAACIREHFERTEKFVTGLLADVRPRDYERFVPQILSLVSGATILAHATRNPAIADVNKEMARQLLTAT